MRGATPLAFVATGLTILVGLSAFGPRTTIRDLVSDGTELGRQAASGAVQAARSIQSPVDAPAGLAPGAQPWGPACQAMKNRLGEPGLAGQAKQDLVRTFRTSCMGLRN